MAAKSLKGREHDLADSKRQIDFSNNEIFASGDLPLFSEKIKQTQGGLLRPKTLEILQINLGYMCNQICAHCHVDAGPDRKEIMSKKTLEKCLQILEKPQYILDLTGGAPEMHPDFRWFVSKSSPNRGFRSYRAFKSYHPKSK
tara:strand:+ start:99 stop:527 length:429 start_codon:yes stop_codon:yes gene_type:complete